MDYSHGDWDPDRMVDHARSLQEVARYLEPDLESDESGGYLFSGRVIAPPILLALATEIALKALQCCERGGAPDRTHDLLDLFDALTKQPKLGLRHIILVTQLSTTTASSLPSSRECEKRYKSTGQRS